MPRKRKTMSGDPAQKIASVPGQRYGEGQDQQDMQQAMPAPDIASVAIDSATGGASPINQVARPQVDPAAISAYLGANNPGLLVEDDNPDIPVTSGLSSGPGNGPEALGAFAANTPLARTLRRLAQETGNPLFNRLAERAGL